MSNLSKRRQFLVKTSAIAAILPVSTYWSKPVLKSVITPAHAQTSVFEAVCQDGSSLWLMSDYIENGVAFDQGSPQSQVQMTISGTAINLTTDWNITNGGTISRGRVTDQGSIDLTTGFVSTNPSGSPIPSPTHGGVTNLANNLPQTFTLDCANSNDVIVSAGNIYQFRLSRIG